MTFKKGSGAVPALAALVLVGAAAQAQAAYTFTTFDTFGGSFSVGLAVNRAGVVVGRSALPPDHSDPPEEPVHAAKWNGPVGVDLGSGTANGINDSGTIAGSDGTTGHATLWRSDGGMVDLGTLGGAGGSAYAINMAGAAVGASWTAGDARLRAFVWRKGQIKALKDLGGSSNYALALSNKNGYIAGRISTKDSVNHGAVWKDGVLTDLGENHWVFGVNSSGTAVGYAPAHSQGIQTVEAAAWNGLEITYLGCLRRDYQCNANAINDAGAVVGESRGDASNDNRAVMWTNGKVVDLNTKLDQASRDAGWVLIDARAISSNGAITGMAHNTITGVFRGYLLSR